MEHDKAVLEELQRTTCRKTVITQVEFFSVLLWESLSSENLVAMFFFCNTHYVVAGAQFLWWGWIWICCSVLPSIRLAVLLNGPESIHPYTSPPWPGWMNDGVALWWPGAGWLMGYWCDGGLRRFRCRGGAITAGKDPGVLRMMARVTSSITVETCWERDV